MSVEQNSSPRCRRQIGTPAAPGARGLSEPEARKEAANPQRVLIPSPELRCAGGTGHRPRPVSPRCQHARTSFYLQVVFGPQSRTPSQEAPLLVGSNPSQSICKSTSFPSPAFTGTSLRHPASIRAPGRSPPWRRAAGCLSSPHSAQPSSSHGRREGLMVTRLPASDSPVVICCSRLCDSRRRGASLGLKEGTFSCHWLSLFLSWSPQKGQQSSPPCS